ncbi:hypothetical protein ACHAWF_015253 [Thalassiosira exigua]
MPATPPTDRHLLPVVITTHHHLNATGEPTMFNRSNETPSAAAHRRHLFTTAPDATIHHNGHGPRLHLTLLTTPLSDGMTPQASPLPPQPISLRHYKVFRLIAERRRKYKYKKFAEVKPLIDHPLFGEKIKERIIEECGKWGFFDGDEEKRSTNDYLAEYPNRDVPRDDMPDYAWQVDVVFVNHYHYLDAASKMISKAMEAIFIELGHPELKDINAKIARKKMVHWTKVNLSTADNTPPKYTKRGDRGDGGWITSRSHNDLVCRLLHAIMTSDTFIIFMGGHSTQLLDKGITFNRAT